MYLQLRTQSPKSDTREKGYILLLSVLISSIILAISLGIYAISIKEIILASFLKDSEKAFATADRAMECALFWDRAQSVNLMPFTIFATSTEHVDPWVIDAVLYPKSNVICEGVQITGVSAPTNWDVPGLLLGSNQGTTYFSMQYPDGTCADVHVEKSSAGTSFISEGYNTCDTTNPHRINRTLLVTSNI